MQLFSIRVDYNLLFVKAFPEWLNCYSKNNHFIVPLIIK